MNAPESIPTHLKHLSDYSMGPDGSVSFLDTKNNPNNLFGEAARTSLSPAQSRATFDRQYRLNNFDNAISEQYLSNRAHPKSFMESLTGSLGRKMQGAFNSATSSPNAARNTSGILAALAGGTLGAAFSDEHKVRNGLLAALLAGGAGYGLSALSKKANTLSPQDLVAMINSASDINRDHRGIFIQKVNSMSPHQLAQLENLIAGAKGAGVGFLLAKFFNIPWLLPSALGGLVGVAVSRPIKFNAFGQPRL